MVPIVLHHDDSGAPALTGEAGSLIAILKWALPQLGWTLEFEDVTNNRAAFRNNPATGSGYYLRVRDNAVDHSFDDRVAAFEGFSNMTDVDTGLDGFPAASDSFFLKSPSANATVREYTIIGTSGFFWWLPSFPTLQPGHRIFGAGDYLAFDPADATNFCILGKESASDNTFNFYSGIQALENADGGNSNQPRIAFDRAGTSPGQQAETLGASHTTARSYVPGATGEYPDPYSGSVNTSRVVLADISRGLANIGILPGILAPLANIKVQEQSDFTNRQIVPAISNGKGAVDAIFLALDLTFGWTSTSAKQGAIFFDITSDWQDW